MVINTPKYDLVRLRCIAELVVGSDVLDIGHAKQHNPYLVGKKCTGFDLNIGENCDYEIQVQGNVFDIGRQLSGQHFDAIIAAEFIEHLEDPYKFLKSLKPLLKPGGCLILSTPNPVAFPTLLFEWVRSHRFFFTENHKHYFSPRWVERILDHSGYQVLQVKPVGLWPLGFPRRIPAALSYQVIYLARAKRSAK